MMVRTVRNRLLSLVGVLMVIAIGTSVFWQIGLSAGTTGSPGTHKVAAGESAASIAAHYGVSVADLNAANNLRRGDLLYKGQVLVLPVSGEAPAAAMPEPVEEQAAMAAAGPTTYKVQSGDSVAGIAQKFGVSVAALYAANNLRPTDLLYKGQVLTIPAPGAEVAMPVGEEEAAMAAAPRPRTYKVESGDTVAGIAQKFGVSVASLMAANDLRPGDLLYKGQILTIPVPGEAPAATPEPAEEPTPAAEEEATPTPVAEKEATPAPEEEATPTPEEDVTPAPAEEATPSPEEEATPAAEEAPEVASLTVTDQPLGADNTVVVSEVTATESGFVVIHEELVGAPGPMLAFAPVPQGTSNDVVVTLGEAVPEGTVLFAVLYNDAGELGAFEFPGPDDPVTVNNQLVSGSFVITAAPVGAAAEMTTTATVTVTEEVTVTADVTATAEPTEAAEAEAAPTADLVDTAVAAGNFSTLVTALETAGVAELLKGEGPFTVFAPTDEAFANLPEGTLEALLADPTGALLEVLFYHVVAGELRAADVSDGLEVETLQGSSIRFTVVDGAVQVDGATIVAADVEANNGVIHVVDAVLLPPTVSVSGGESATSDEPVAPSEEVTATEEITVAVGTVETDAQVDVQVVAGAPSASATAWPAPAENVAVFSPIAGGAYHSPIEVTGLARTAEGTVSISLLNAAGELLADRTAAGGAGEDFGFFTTSLRFSVDEPVAAVLNVVELDMAEGTVLTEIRRPVVLLPGQRSVDITYPTTGAVVCGPLTVSGYANTFEANVLLQLRDPDNALLEQLPAMGGTLGVYREFGATFDLGELNAPAAVLVSANESDASGRYLHVDRTVVPVTVYPAGDPACTPS